MAGRILPIALATVAGVTIGVATFGEEFKEQQKRRIEEEYKREIAAVSALPSDGPSTMASSAIPAPQPEPLPAQTDTEKSSKISSTLGFWAWSSKTRVENATKEQPPTRNISDTSNQQP